MDTGNPRIVTDALAGFRVEKNSESSGFKWRNCVAVTSEGAASCARAAIKLIRSTVPHRGHRFMSRAIKQRGHVCAPTTRR
ncbi:hypothetical protein EVAR_20728_1 [Eumeta japonica]|uniref:Uncharacterized protein n=1 Tax=Eumeta variegata TaxID=151549 RepID=A0A4C1VCL1_EUMVA|nr:hypothetical protein EVAR_20728_1 [Eumeta japonica]